MLPRNSSMLTAALLAIAGATGAAQAPPPAAPRPASTAVAVLAGGCYWGVESVFRHVRGVVSVTSGYALPAGGLVSHRAEAVRLVYDPARISYRQILDVFFSVVHDPTQLNRQGPDVGEEYRSAVFADGEAQRRLVRAVIDSLGAARVYARPIVTEIDALRGFQVVGEDQQDYAAKHPTDPYIVANDAPKIEALRRRFPGLYRI